MKKILYVLIFFLLMFQVNVYASEDEGVTFSLECESLNLSPLGSATCDLVVSTISTVSVDGVNLTIDSDVDLGIEYVKGQYFDGNLNGGSLVLSANEVKSGNFKLGKIKITVSETATFEKKNITLKNISFFNSTTTEMYSCTNISKEINVLSDNNKLKSITIDGKMITNFDANTLKYELELDKDKIKIDASKDDDTAKIEGLGEKVLKYGKNSLEVKVTSQKGTVKTYILNITRPDNRNDDNTLKTLTIDGINFKFDSKTTNYKINVDSDVSEISINSTLNDENASYAKDFGNREVKLKYGENKVLIKVLSEKETEKVYTLTINRADDRSDVAKLISLKINEQEVELVDGVFEYEVTLLHRFDKTLVSAEANEESTIEYKDMDLVVGNNELIIKVISEKETEQDYKINIKRLTEDESKAIHEKIEVSGYELSFDKNNSNYNLKIDKEDKELKINVLSNDPEMVTYSVSGNNNLKNGSTVIINVKDDLGEYVYTINIQKDVEENLILGFLTIEQLCYIVFSIGAVVFIISIIYAIKRKISKKK